MTSPGLFLLPASSSRSSLCPLPGIYVHRHTHTHIHMPPASSRQRDPRAPPRAHSCPPVGLGSRDNTGDRSPFPSFHPSIASPESSCLGGGLSRALPTLISALLHDTGLIPAAPRSSLAALKRLEMPTPLFWPRLLSLCQRIKQKRVYSQMFKRQISSK